MLSSVPFEQLTTRPLDCQEMQPTVGFSDLNRADNIGMLHAGSILSLSHKAGYGCSVEPKLFSEYLECHRPMRLVGSSIDCGGPAFADLTLDGVPGYLRAEQALFRHAAKLIETD